MKTIYTVAFTAALMAACGPTDIDVWITSGGDTSSSSADDSSGPGASDSGQADSSTGPAEDPDSSGTTGGGSDSSSGVPPACAAELHTQVCYCDEVVSPPEMCGCYNDPVGWCSCPEDMYERPCPNGDVVCEVNPVTQQCGCTLADGSYVGSLDPESCSCTPSSETQSCWCGEGCTGPGEGCVEWPLITCYPEA